VGDTIGVSGGTVRVVVDTIGGSGGHGRGGGGHGKGSG
jgi:hypothetical protein